MKALFINGSPRKNGNTAQLLKRAMDGAFMERMEFPAVNYSDYSKPVVLKRICSATIYTMPPRSARLTRPRCAIISSLSTSKKPMNWASVWSANVIKQRGLSKQIGIYGK